MVLFDLYIPVDWGLFPFIASLSPKPCPFSAAPNKAIKDIADEVVQAIQQHDVLDLTARMYMLYSHLDNNVVGRKQSLLAAVLKFALHLTHIKHMLILGSESLPLKSSHRTSGRSMKEFRLHGKHGIIARRTQTLQRQTDRVCKL
jgi:hypothetical protein